MDDDVGMFAVRACVCVCARLDVNVRVNVHMSIVLDER